MPIYEYACEECGFKLEELRSMDQRHPIGEKHDTTVCPKCDGDFRRRFSVFSDARPTGFTTHKILPPKVLSESGQLAQRVSDTDI